MWRWLFLLFALLSTDVGAQSISVPDGYVLQPLEPTDGVIARPKDWLYLYRPTQSGWMWTISAEDPSKWYDTGWRTQVLIGVESGTKRPRADFANNFLQQKRASSQVLRDCAPGEQGAFIRACLEVVEDIKTPTGNRKFRVLYSVFWGQQIDMVAITTAGTPEQNWDNVRPIFEVMQGFVLVGANFADRARQTAPANQ